MSKCQSLSGKSVNSFLLCAGAGLFVTIPSVFEHIQPISQNVGSNLFF